MPLHLGTRWRAERYSPTATICGVHRSPPPAGDAGRSRGPRWAAPAAPGDCGHRRPPFRGRRGWPQLRPAATRGQGYGPLRLRTVRNFTMRARYGPLWAGRHGDGPLWPVTTGRAIDGRYRAAEHGVRGRRRPASRAGGAGQRAVHWAAPATAKGAGDGRRPTGPAAAHGGRAGPRPPCSGSLGPRRVPSFAEDYSHQCTHRWPGGLGGASYGHGPRSIEPGPPPFPTFSHSPPTAHTVIRARSTGPICFRCDLGKPPQSPFRCRKERAIRGRKAGSANLCKPLKPPLDRPGIP